MAHATSPGRTIGRLVAYSVSVALLTMVLVPVTWERPRDSFPLSSYPMFAGARERVSRVATVVGITSEGERVILDPWLIGASDEVILASATVWRAVADRGDSSNRLCREVADRLASRPGRVSPKPQRLEVAVERFDTVTYFRGDTAPLTRDVVARCPLPEEQP